ncbi:MAG: lasso peptide biosynthesis B2 protein [Cyanobacteria bacterium P01_F01_bin.150]
MKQFIYKLFVLLNTYFFVILIRLGLWLVPAKTVLLFQSGHFAAWTTIKFNYSISTLVWAIKRSSTLPLGKMKCLGQALVLQSMMSLSGHTSKVCFGVAKGDNTQIEAHAWVEYQDQIIVGQINNMSRFYPLNTWVASRK